MVNVCGICFWSTLVVKLVLSVCLKQACRLKSTAAARRQQRIAWGHESVPDKKIKAKERCAFLRHLWRCGKRLQGMERLFTIERPNLRAKWEKGLQMGRRSRRCTTWREIIDFDPSVVVAPILVFVFPLGIWTSVLYDPLANLVRGVPCWTKYCTLSFLSDSKYEPILCQIFCAP